MTHTHGSPSEEAVFIRTSGQLQNLIMQAVQKAIQPLQDVVAALREGRKIEGPCRDSRYETAMGLYGGTNG